MGSVEKTKDHNVEVLVKHGFEKISNTTVFHKGKTSLISPAVAQNNSGSYWFDLRQVNLDRLSKEAYLLVRIVPNLFIFQTISSIQSLITTDLMDNRPHSGNVWGIKMNLSQKDMKASLFNLKDSSTRLPVNLLSLNEICNQLVSLRLPSE